jgi:hypothetical protein
VTIGVTYFGKFSDSDGSGTLRKWKPVAIYVFPKDQSRPRNSSTKLCPRNSTKLLSTKLHETHESPTAKGFYTGGGGTGSAIYKVGIDDTVSYSGHQSLKMEYVGDAGRNSP